MDATLAKLDVLEPYIIGVLSLFIFIDLMLEEVTRELSSEMVSLL
jgi:hypothetical protein